MKKINKTPTPDAAESNAGDDFHRLWVVKRALDLLNFDPKGLRVISVEGLVFSDSLVVDPEKKNLLGVDIAEYFGGENIEGATKIVVSQLKYSTRRKYEDWTFSKLSISDNREKTNSFFGRQGQIFKSFLDRYDRNIVLDKLNLKLISNRNLNSRQKEILDKIKAFLGSINTEVDISVVISAFPHFTTEITQVHTATKLNDTQITDYLRLVDFEDCGIGSSYAQEIEIISTILKLGASQKGQFPSLYLMANKKMLPESIKRGFNRITLYDILGCFDMSFENLLPVKQKFNVVSKPVERLQTDEIYLSIKDKTTPNCICLHGSAGIGKSTIVQLLEKKYSSESEFILFDCYGGGDYLNPSDNRHLHKEGIIQICNQLAIKFGTPFLLGRDKEPYELVREFKARIIAAIETINTINPNKLLIIIIDASDNSVLAGLKTQTKSFVQDIIHESYPANFKIVLTARSSRVSELNLPTEAILIQLKEFEPEESIINLKIHFPSSTLENGRDFHKLTFGNPRAQSYVLDQNQGNIESVLDYLKPNGKTLNNIIADNIKRATLNLGPNGSVILKSFFTFLYALPRPVPIRYISDLLSMEIATIKDFAIDIWHGLILENECFSFRDEDFEATIGELYPSTEAVYQAIANKLLLESEKDDYASVNLGNYLFLAKLFSNLKDIVLNEKYKSLPIDPIRKKEVNIERILLCLKCCQEENNTTLLLKILFLYAEAVKTNSAIKNLLVNNADLVASYGDDHSLLNIFSNHEGATWAGSFYLELSGIYSRDGATKFSAIDYLEKAFNWINWRQVQIRQNERSSYRIFPESAAYGVEAILRTSGPNNALRWLKGFKSIQLMYLSSTKFIENLLKYSSKNEIKKWLSEVKLDLFDKLLLLKNTYDYNFIPYNFESLLNQISKCLKRKVNFNFLELDLIFSFFERSVELNPKSKKDILKLLSGIDIHLPEYAPHFLDGPNGSNEEKYQVSAFLKKYIIESFINNKETIIEDIYTKKIKLLSIKGGNSQEVAKFRRFYKHAVTIFCFRLKLITSKNKITLEKDLKSICDSIKNDWELRYYSGYQLKFHLHYLFEILLENLAYISFDQNIVTQLITSFEIKNDTNLDLRLITLNYISISPFSNKLTLCVKLSSEIDLIISESKLTAAEKSEYYIKCARCIRHLDINLSRWYFDKSIEIISEVDVEAQDQIECLYNLSQKGLKNPNPQLAFEMTRFVENSYYHLMGYEHFPIDMGLICISNLDIASGFKTLCRFDHRNIIDITEHILDLIDTSLEKGFINPVTACSLLPLNKYYWKTYVVTVKRIIVEFDKNSDYINKTRFLLNVLRDVQKYCNRNDIKYTINEIYDSIKDGLYTKKEILNKFQIYTNFINRQFPGSHRDEYKNSFSNSFIVEDAILKRLNINSPASLEFEFENLKSKTELSHSRWPIDKLLEMVLNNCSANDYITHLNALVNVSIENIDFYSFEKAITERLNAWSYHPIVKSWAIENFSFVLEKWFSSFALFESFHIGQLIDFSKTFFIEISELQAILINSISRHLNKLSVKGLYKIISFLGERFTLEENEELIKWILFRLNKKIKIELTDGRWNEFWNKTKTSEETITNFTRYLLGHPDKIIRWRAIHSIERQLNFGYTNNLKILLKLQNERHCNEFQSPDYIYFWLSSKLYLWISIAKLSTNFPELLIGFKSEFLHELDEVNQHALILYFIKVTLSNISTYDKKIFSTSELTAIQNILTSNYFSSTLSSKRSNSIPKSKFKFDSMDTLPYWFEPLGRCFSISSVEVANIADKYIGGYLGYIGDPAKDAHVKYKNNYDSVSNSQGTIPKIESLRKYFEYHSMYFAACELLKTKEVHYDDYDSENPFLSWLKDDSTKWDRFWMSDLRDPLPLAAKFWKWEFNKLDDRWETLISENYYLDALGLKNKLKSKIIIPYGGYTRFYGSSEESVSITSALVSEKTSYSLLRALQLTKNKYDYRIPLENDELEFKVDQFEFLGWLTIKKSENNGLDEHDPFANNVGSSIIKFGDKIDEIYGIQYSRNLKKGTFRNRQISRDYQWDNTTLNKSYDSFESHGHLLKVDIDFLIEILKTKKMSLLIQCSIERRAREKIYNYKDPKRNSASLFLIDKNGKVKSIRHRNFAIR